MEVPIWRGAERFGDSTVASERLAGLPERTDVLALGPLTNLAVALESDPGLAGRATLRWVGGNLARTGPGLSRRPLDFNFLRDRRAARRVLSAPWRALVLYPLGVVASMRVDAVRLDRLAGLSPLGRYLADHSRRWVRRARWRYLAPAFPVWDLPAALDAIGLLSGDRPTPSARGSISRFFGNTAEPSWVSGFDPNKAWAAFEQLLLAQLPPGPLIDRRQEVS